MKDTREQTEQDVFQRDEKTTEARTLQRTTQEWYLLDREEIDTRKTHSALSACRQELQRLFAKNKISTERTHEALVDAGVVSPDRFEDTNAEITAWDEPFIPEVVLQDSSGRSFYQPFSPDSYKEGVFQERMLVMVAVLEANVQKILKERIAAKKYKPDGRVVDNFDARLDRVDNQDSYTASEGLLHFFKSSETKNSYPIVDSLSMEVMCFKPHDFTFSSSINLLFRDDRLRIIRLQGIWPGSKIVQHTVKRDVLNFLNDERKVLAHENNGKTYDNLELVLSEEPSLTLVSSDYYRNDPDLFSRREGRKQKQTTYTYDPMRKGFTRGDSYPVAFTVEQFDEIAEGIAEMIPIRSHLIHK